MDSINIAEKIEEVERLAELKKRESFVAGLEISKTIFARFISPFVGLSESELMGYIDCSYNYSPGHHMYCDYEFRIRGIPHMFFYVLPYTVDKDSINGVFVCPNCGNEISVGNIDSHRKFLDLYHGRGACSHNNCVVYEHEIKQPENKNSWAFWRKK